MESMAGFAFLSCQNEQLTSTYLCFTHSTANRASACYSYLQLTETHQAALLPTRNMTLISTAGKRGSIINTLFRHGLIHLSKR